MSGLRCDTSWWKLSCLLLIPTTLERNTVTALTEWLGLTTKRHILCCSQRKKLAEIISFPYWIYFSLIVFSQLVTCCLASQGLSDEFDILETLDVLPSFFIKFMGFFFKWANQKSIMNYSGLYITLLVLFKFCSCWLVMLSWHRGIGYPCLSLHWFILASTCSRSQVSGISQTKSSPDTVVTPDWYASL